MMDYYNPLSLVEKPNPEENEAENVEELNVAKENEVETPEKVEEKIEEDEKDDTKIEQSFKLIRAISDHIRDKWTDISARYRQQNARNGLVFMALDAGVYCFAMYISLLLTILLVATFFTIELSLRFMPTKIEDLVRKVVPTPTIVDNDDKKHEY